MESTAIDVAEEAAVAMAEQVRSSAISVPLFNKFYADTNRCGTHLCHEIQNLYRSENQSFRLSVTMMSFTYGSIYRSSRAFATNLTSTDLRSPILRPPRLRGPTQTHTG